MVECVFENILFFEFDVIFGLKVFVSKVEEVWKIFGYIDVLVNNVGIFVIVLFEDIRYVKFLLR